MKLKKSSKPSSVLADKVSALESKEADTANPTSWLTRGKKVAAFVESIKQGSQRVRKPEFYVKTDESKRIRFRTSEPLACFQVYAFRSGGMWQSYTAPGDDQRDLFRENGLRPMFKAAYEIIDLDGYVPKKGKNAGKAVKNVPSFFVVGMRLYEQIAMLQKKYGDLTDRTFTVSRTGSGQQTVYTILPDDPEEMPALDKIPSIADKLSTYYAPPSLAEQKRIMAGYNPDEQEDYSARRPQREKEE